MAKTPESPILIRKSQLPYQSSNLPIFQSSIAPEIELILLCSRPRLSRNKADRARELIQNGIDWPRLLKRADSWGVVPLLSRGLKAAGQEYLPRTVSDRIQALHFASVRQSLLQAGELVALLDLFDTNNIPAIPYKGPVLAQMIYGGLALRPFGDLDIIIHREDVNETTNLLLNAGYKLTWPQIQLTDSQSHAHLHAKYNYKFMHPEHLINVELHWGITPKYFSFPSDPEWLWQRLEPLSFAGRTLHTFTPGDYLLILCAHGANHCWLYRLNWVCDIAELLHRYPGLNWEYVLMQAQILGGRRMLFLGLLLAHDLLGSELPAGIWRQVKADRMIKNLAGQSIERFTSIDGGSLPAFYIPRYQISVRERLRDRVRYALFMSEPSVKDWSGLPLPAPFAFIYYLMRPIRLLLEHGLTPLRHRLRQII